MFYVYSCILLLFLSCTSKKVAGPIPVTVSESYQNLDRAIVNLSEIKDKRSIDYEIALSEVVTDIKYVTLESLRNGNSLMALYQISRGVNVAPFRGDLVSIKKEVLNGFIFATNKMLTSEQINCNEVNKRMRLIQEVAPDFTIQINYPKDKCGTVKFALDSEKKLSVTDLLSDLTIKDNQTEKYDTFVSYDYPGDDVFLNVLRYFEPIKFETIFVNQKNISLDGKGVRVEGEIQTKGWLRENEYRNEFCDRLEKILSYDGDDKRKFKCAEMEFYITPRAEYELTSTLQNLRPWVFVPKNLIFKTSFYFKNMKKQTRYSFYGHHLFSDKRFFDGIGEAKERDVVIEYGNIDIELYYSKNQAVNRLRFSSGHKNVKSFFHVVFDFFEKENKESELIGMSIDLDIEQMWIFHQENKKNSVKIENFIESLNSAIK